MVQVDKYMNQYFYSQDQILSLQENKIARLRSGVISCLGHVCLLIQAVFSSTAIKSIKLSA